AFLIPRPGVREKLSFVPTLLFQLPRFFQRNFWRRLKYELTYALPLYYITTFILFTAFFVAFLPFPLYLKTLGISDSLVFFIYVLNSIMSTFTHALTGKLAENLGSKKIFATALSSRIFIFSFFAIFVLLFPQWAIFFVTFLFLMAGITWGIIAVSGSALLINIAPPERQGHAFGTYNATISLATTVGSLLGGFLAFYVGYSLTFYTAAVIVGIGTVFMIKIKF
ncbi:MAG: MFS transporter, partial [Promethearchaeota archaeon]